MIDFSIAGTVVDSLTTDLRGVSDIDLIQVDGRWFLLVAARADSAISTFELNALGAPTLVDSQEYTNNSGTGTVWRLNYILSGGDLLVLPATRYEDQTVLYKLDGSGLLSSPLNSGISGSGIGISETVTVGDTNYVYVQNYGGQSLSVYRMTTDQHLTEVQVLNDRSKAFTLDISALEQVHLGSKTFLMVASAFDSGLSSYGIDSSGQLSLLDRVLPDSGSGFTKPVALAAIEVGTHHFLVMASAGTSSLTVYRIANNGNLSETDHLLDSLDTRFQGASVLESFSFQGRHFLVAAGSDDGITVLELQEDGRLRVESSLADTYDTTLDNVSGLAVQVLGGVPVLFVSSPTDHGFTRIELSISADYTDIQGSKAEDDITGTSGNDRIFGHAENDRLRGAAGDDWIEDGTGADTLTGGAGADVFVFVEDGETDVVTDFDIAQDRIDLSGFSHITDYSDLRIVSGCGGVLIYADGEFLKLEFSGHDSFSALDLTADHFVF